MKKPDQADLDRLKRAARTAQAIGPLGRAITRDDLPPANTRRWVTRRKAEVVAGVRQGLITLAEACERYDLTVDEFLSWQKRLESHGMTGLQVTRLVELRRKDRTREEDEEIDLTAMAKRGTA